MEPRRGAIALCSKGRLGLITSDWPQAVLYADGTTGIAWLGIQLTAGEITGVGADKAAVMHQQVGDPWSSRTPIVVGYIEDLFRVQDGRKVWDFVPEFAHALVAHLRDKDDPRWRDTWLKRPRKGQEDRIIANFTDKFDKYQNAGQPIDWLAVAGDAMIAYTREQHPEVWPE